MGSLGHSSGVAVGGSGVGCGCVAVAAAVGVNALGVDVVGKAVGLLQPPERIIKASRITLIVVAGLLTYVLVIMLDTLLPLLTLK